MIRRKRPHTEQYQDMIARLYPELHNKDLPDGRRSLTKTVTFQVTEDCNLACTYCYQIHKTKKRMSFDTAKKAVVMLLSATPENNSYINPVLSPGIVIDFIGGEPFLETDLIINIINYFEKEARRLQHPWAQLHCFSICSNGVLYFEENVQKLLLSTPHHMSFSITIDGNKELHDSCRIFPDGRPSYDIAVAAAKDWMSKGYVLGSKITIAPANVSFVYDAITHMISLGYTEINANCVYEEGWNLPHASVLYYEMKRISDYLLDNNLETEIYISLYEDDMFHPMDENDNNNWCGGDGNMLCIDPDGNYSPCLRYLPSSLGDDQPPIYIGNVDRGLVTTDEEKHTVKCMNCITRRSQSTDECFNCPIAQGCSWCSAYNYQCFGTVDKRATFICDMHKARALANVYFWNKFYKKHNDSERFINYCPDEWALTIISESELSMLKELEK